MKKTALFITSLMLVYLLSVCAYASTDSSAVFEDIPENAWYKASIDTVLEKGLMRGVSENKFAPDNLTTRATIITILWRMNGSPEVAEEAPFSDLTQAWYKSAISWAYKNAIVNGVSQTSFAPDADLSRDGIVTILYRFYISMGGKNADKADLSVYADADKINSWAADAFSWATAEGIVTGSDGKLRPTDSASRAELAAMIVRFYNKYDYLFEQVDDPDEDELYKSITCAQTAGYTEAGFGINDFDYVLSLRYPAEWSIEKVDGEAYKILCDGKTVGEIVHGVADDVKLWKTVNYINATASNVVTRRYIEKIGAGESLGFRYRFVYECKVDRITEKITVTVDYSALNSKANKWVYLESGFAPKTLKTDPISGIYEELDRADILIIGNSFVNTSKVGSILAEMFSINNKKCTVNAISRGYATVKTYVDDSGIMRDIKDGTYDAVFICGLYSGEEIINLVTLKEACDKSDTKMILFPAHNESRDVINTALKKHPEFEIIDWKNEIDNFIVSGVDKWDFCINDQHLHSTTLAGYVGAHMIYRSIYGVPQGKVSNTIAQKDVDALLGDYRKTGIVKFNDFEIVNYFE